MKSPQQQFRILTLPGRLCAPELRGTHDGAGPGLLVEVAKDSTLPLKIHSSDLDWNRTGVGTGCGQRRFVHDSPPQALIKGCDCAEQDSGYDPFGPQHCLALCQYGAGESTMLHLRHRCHSSDPAETGESTACPYG